jgi:hypothetical protein
VGFLENVLTDVPPDRHDEELLVYRNHSNIEGVRITRVSEQRARRKVRGYISHALSFLILANDRRDPRSTRVLDGLLFDPP